MNSGGVGGWRWANKNKGSTNNAPSLAQGLDLQVRPHLAVSLTGADGQPKPNPELSIHSCAQIYMADAITYLTDAHWHRLRILWSHACTVHTFWWRDDSRSHASTPSAPKTCAQLAASLLNPPLQSSLLCTLTLFTTLASKTRWFVRLGLVVKVRTWSLQTERNKDPKLSLAPSPVL